MPTFFSNRSLLSLYYLKENDDGSIEFLSSSLNTDQVAEQQAKAIGKNVLANNIINYSKLVPVENGCEWTSVLCVDIGGSIPDALQRTGAAL